VWCAHQEGEVHHGRFCARQGAELVLDSGMFPRLLHDVTSKPCTEFQITQVDMRGLHALQKPCRGRGDEPCNQYWKPSAEAPGHVCLDLGSSYLSQPTAQLDVVMQFTSS
jgi:hypothetical protein